VRPGLLKEVQFPDELSNRFQKNVKDAVETLAADHDVLSVPVTALSASSAIMAGKSVVVYSGNPGATLTLPLASAQGKNTGAVVLVVNASGGEITVRASAKNTINGAPALALAALSMVVLLSDGATKWFASSSLTEDRVKIIASYHP